MSREAQEPRSGHTIAGRYDLDSIIGRGGHGLVWKARDRQTGRQVAVKMLTDVAAKDPQHVERLRREQLALVKLAGTAAVELIDLCQTSAGKLCLVMELLDGVDLEAHLERLEQRGQRISVTTLLAVLEPVVATLERAHEQGIIHRDLKPANVFLLAERAGGGVRVLDFGLARLRSQLPLTAAGTIVGSPSYIAPEAWKGRSEGLDQRVDVYSFGVLVFRALSGQFPFPGTSLQDKFKGATSAERPGIRHLRRDVPEEVDDWVKQVLAIDPDLRFRTLRGAWNGLLAALGNPALAHALVTAEDLASAAAAAPPLDAPIPEAPPEPKPAPPPPAHPAASPAESGSIEIPMAGALPVIKAVFQRAATAVARVADAVTGGERKRTPVPVEPSPARERAPGPSPDKPAPVSVAPVVAVGGRAREGGSMVRQWLAGSDLDMEARAKREPSDVVSWLSGDESGSPREPTLLHGVRAPAEEKEKEPEAAETSTLARARRATTKTRAPKKKAAKKASVKKAGSTRSTTKKTTPKKSAAKKSVAKKKTKKAAKKTSPKKPAAKKARPKKAPAKKSG